MIIIKKRLNLKNSQSTRIINFLKERKIGKKRERGNCYSPKDTTKGLGAHAPTPTPLSPCLC